MRPWVAFTTEGYFSLFGNDTELPTGFLQSTIDASCDIALPRWRYWKPDTSPSWVRLLHRGDGLGMNTRRLRGRGSSHQAGRLRGSY